MASKSFTNGFRPRRALVAGGAVAVFLMGALFGGMASLTLWPQQQDPFNLMQAELPGDAQTPDVSPENNMQAVGGDRTVCVLDTTQVEWISAFSACGHECVESDTESAVGMTLEELKSTYADYEVRMFTTAKVKLKRELMGYCPKHYVLLLDHGTVCVKRTDPDTFLPYVVMEIPIEIDALDEETRAELEVGIPFDSLEQINVFFESLES